MEEEGERVGKVYSMCRTVGGRDDEEKINWGCFGFSFFFVLVCE